MCGVVAEESQVLCVITCTNLRNDSPSKHFHPRCKYTALICPAGFVHTAAGQVRLQDMSGQDLVFAALLQVAGLLQML